MGFRRDWFTGELEEVPSEGGGRQIIFRGAVPPVSRRRHVDPWDSSKDYVNKAMSLKPEDATPERIAAENEAARKHGTGAYYDSNGNCHCPTRRSLAREMARPHGPQGFYFQNNDAGYGDCAGR